MCTTALNLFEKIRLSDIKLNKKNKCVNNYLIEIVWRNYVSAMVATLMLPAFPETSRDTQSIIRSIPKISI